MITTGWHIKGMSVIYSNSINVRSNHRENTCAHFQYWTTIMKLELCMFIFIHFLRAASFKMYLDALTELGGFLFI